MKNGLDIEMYPDHPPGWERALVCQIAGVEPDPVSAAALAAHDAGRRRAEESPTGPFAGPGDGTGTAESIRRATARSMLREHLSKVPETLERFSARVAALEGLPEHEVRQAVLATLPAQLTYDPEELVPSSSVPHLLDPSTGQWYVGRSLQALRRVIRANQAAAKRVERSGRAPYTVAQRRKLVAKYHRLRDAGVDTREVANRLGVARTTLRRWEREMVAADAPPEPVVVSLPERVRLQDATDEVREAVEAALDAGESVTAVARRYGVHRREVQNLAA